MNRRVLSLLVGLAIGTGLPAALPAVAQTNSADSTRRASTPEQIDRALDEADERATKLEGEINKLKALKISGYVQFEWQRFSQTGSVGGRALYSDARRNFFTIRRGRLKFQHKLNDVMSGVIQTDITETGVRIKDAYGQFNLLPAEELTVTAGLFNRPNHEVEFSSSSRESSERAQVVRAFYPDERDLGVMFSSRKELFENFTPKLQVGVFNGVGSAAETDAYKDIIARLTFPVPLGRTSPVHIDLGTSFYYGGIPQTGDSVLRTENGVKSLVANTESGSWPGWGNRENVNVEAQIYLDILPVGGTIIKGEFLTGRRPTTAVAGRRADTVNFTPAVTARPFQIRNQMGYYAYFIQNFGARFQIAAKYDFYDRNTDLSGTQATSLDDAAYGVLGVGGSIFIDNLRIMLWHEIPTVAADENGPQDIKDDKTTVRFQYKF